MRKHIKQISFRLTPEVAAQLAAIKERDGVPLSEQIRRAVLLWIDSKALAPTSPRLDAAVAMKRGRR